jgi:Protein of unknown function (DUF2795)
MSGNDNNNLKGDQIPSRQNEDQTRRMAQEQNQVSGQRRDKEVTDFPKAAALGQALKGLEFPAEKNKIIQHLQQQSQANPDCQKMIPILEKIEDKQYANAADVTQAAGLVQ